jgi:MarR family transcriptional regulator, organic hydroperoxide resistance regulator
MAKKNKEKMDSQFEANDEVVFPKAVRDNVLSYMIFQVAKTHRGLAGELLRPTGLYPGQEILLMQLWDKDAQTQSELIARMGIDASTVTKMVQRLEAEGHITRTQSETDRRAFIVSLSPSGQKLRLKVEKMWADLNAATVKNLSKPEEKLLTELLHKAYSGLSDFHLLNRKTIQK